jgi:ribosome-associated translation inhibitor RaiA
MIEIEIGMNGQILHKCKSKVEAYVAIDHLFNLIEKNESDYPKDRIERIFEKGKLEDNNLSSEKR